VKVRPTPLLSPRNPERYDSLVHGRPDYGIDHNPSVKEHDDEDEDVLRDDEDDEEVGDQHVSASSAENDKDDEDDQDDEEDEDEEEDDPEPSEILYIDADFMPGYLHRLQERRRHV